MADFRTNRPNHIIDWLAHEYNGQWFTFSDLGDQVYANLILQPVYGTADGVRDNPLTELPTEKQCTDGLKVMQDEWDAKDYARNRRSEYHALNQFELISDDAINGTTTHKDAIEAIKTKWPKDNSGPV